jgi:hypothetical protein
MAPDELTKGEEDDGPRPCSGGRRPYRHRKQAHGIRLRPPQLVPLNAEREAEAVAALAELLARRRDSSDS